MKSKSVEMKLNSDAPSKTGMRRQSRGLTLLEVMVTLIIFLLMALFMFAAVREVVSQWTIGERRRVLYEKAAGVVNVIATDLRLVLSHEAPGSIEVKVRFIGDYEPDTPQQRIMFVRSFEYGPERAIISNAGDGLPNNLMFDASVDPEDPDAKPIPKLSKGIGPVDRDEYDGLHVGDFKALGGMAAVGYFVKNETLYRAIHAPVPASLSGILVPEKSQIVATDVLYFSLDYWGQFTESWEEPDGKGRGKNQNGGPERIWDSTRGITVFPLKNFILHRDAISLNDPEDDVFPQKVRLTVTVDSPLPRCTWTRIQNDIDENMLTISVDDTRGFPDGGDDAFIKIEDEWMLVKKKTQDTLILSKRGIRGTKAKGHNANTTVRTGRTFQRIVFIPNYRNDFTPDDVYYARKSGPPKKKAK